MTTSTPLGAADAVLLALHYQNENCHPDGKVRLGIAEGAAGRDAVLGAAKRLIEGARDLGVPVIHVRLAARPDYADVAMNAPAFRQWPELGAWAEGSWGTEFAEGLGPTAGEAVVTHNRNNAFYASTLEPCLAVHRPRRLVCAGVSTAYAVETTVRHAADAGYEVLVAADACSTATQEQHDAALRAMSILATIATVDEVLAELAG